MKKPTLILLVASLSLLGIVIIASVYLLNNFSKSTGLAEKKEFIYEVMPKESFGTIASELEKNDIITNAKLFNLYARLTGKRSKVKSGEYQFHSNMTPSEVLDILCSGHSMARPFTVSEGLNIYEIADLYEKNNFGKKEDFLKLVKDKTFIKKLLGEDLDSLEGYLYPETYLLTKYEGASVLITRMVNNYKKIYSTLQDELKKESADVKTKNWSNNQIMTLASIIEKETGAKEERPKISSVFHNRLMKKMKLQTDPTIIYGLTEQSGHLVNNIHKEDILKPTKYNTYVISGLPPAPIANPGKEAIKAAMLPENTHYLYFVSQNNGTHIFSEDYQKHLQAVKKYQLDPKAREGKSWRDLKQ